MPEIAKEIRRRANKGFYTCTVTNLHPEDAPYVKCLVEDFGYTVSVDNAHFPLESTLYINWKNRRM